MIFNSISFVVFFTIFFIFDWFVFKNHLKLQNLLLLVGSYVFYGWADWRLLSYLIGVSIFNFYLGLFLQNAKDERFRKFYMYLGVLQGIGGLLYFKYFNFFIDSFNDLFHSIDINFNLQTLHIIAPLGISFFTFKTISYILDINKGKIEPTKDWIVFFNYVSFFPTLLSGPIDKAKSFIPQLEMTRVFDYNKIADGMRQILWGLFKKVVIADNIATMTDQIFYNFDSYPSSTLLLGAFLYTVQLYTDFSGYSDMAIGFGRLIGFNVTKNFDFPFFAQNIADFWRKWHISLTTWLTEYVFTPLSISFRDYGKIGLIIAILVNFVLIGIWHGANWTYLWFGFLHGCYFIPLIIRGTMNKRKKIEKNKLLPNVNQFLNMLGTFILVMFANIIFRADNISHALHYMNGMFSTSIFKFPYFLGSKAAIPALIFTIICFIIEWMGRNDEYAIENLGLQWKRPYRLAMYYILVVVIYYFGGAEEQFIYFQF